MKYGATERCPHESTYAQCMNGDCLQLRIDGKVKGLAAYERDRERLEAARLARGLKRG